MGTEVWAYLALIMFVLLILIGIVQYSRKMYRMKVDRWKRYAENRGLLHRTGGAWGLGEMVGEVQGRQVKISAVTQNTRTFERMSVAGTRVDILLHDSMNALYFRLENATDNLPIVGTSEVQIGDDELDPLLRLMGADADRYRQLLLHPEIRPRILQAFDSNGVLVVRHGTLTLARPGQDPGQIEVLLEEALELVERLEKGDGVNWQLAASAFGLEFEQDERTWALRRREESFELSVVYQLQEPSQTLAKIQLDSSLRSLKIGARDLENPGLKSGDPIIDAHLHISGVSPAMLSALRQKETFTEMAVHFVKGHHGTVENGWLWVKQPGLMVDPGDVLADSLTFVDHLEKTLVGSV